MKKTLLASMTCVLLPLASVLAAEQKPVATGNVNKAQGIIDRKCTSCHSRDKIEKAISAGLDMSKIQKKMERQGVKLSSSEQEVLGIFWKQSRPIAK